MTLSLVDQPAVKLTSLIRHLAPVSRPEMQLLRTVTSLETRCRLVMDKRLEVMVGDCVSFLPPQERNCPVRAVVRYVGPVVELAREGHYLGLEVTEPGWVRGTISKHYFTCPVGRAVFCTVGDVNPVIDNNNQWTNTNKLNNLTLLGERCDVITNSSQPAANNLRRIHNNLKNKKVGKQQCSGDFLLFRET